MRDTVVILGSADTRDQFDFERTDCDIWVFNEALHAPWCKRADAVFQMHDPIIFRSSMNRNDPKHYEWLKSGDTPVVYMQEKYPDVPKAEAYPIEEVKARFPRAYFTSSAAYAIVLAIFKGYRHIQIYGIEMATSTEYWHQREGVAYWIGVADGMGIKVEFFSKTMLQSPMYGYEGTMTIPEEYYQERVQTLQAPYNSYKEEYEKAKADLHALLDAYKADFKTDMTDFDKKVFAVGQTGHNFSVIDGSNQVENIFLTKIGKMKAESGHYFIGRQEYDDIARDGNLKSQQTIPRINIEATKLEEISKEFKQASNRDVRRQLVEQFIAQLARYIKSVNINGVLQGSVMECMHLQQKHDQLVRMAGGAKAEEVMMGELKATLEVDA